MQRPSHVLRSLACAAAITSLFAGCASVAPPAEPAAIAPRPTTAAAAPVDPIAALATDAADDAGGFDSVAELEPWIAAEDDPDEPDAVVVSDEPPEINQDLWDRIRAGFKMPELKSPLVAQKERFYLERPDYLQRMFDRGSRYLYHIVEEIEKRGLPTELALLPFVESAMNPTALSSAKAAGLWQFIPSTGKAYDLSQDWWVDNRRDPVHSTRAALDYLQRIHAMNDGDWFLALASYNWGEGAVARAVKRNRARGLKTDYLSLKMPAETRHYVPKLMALKNIILNSAELGVALPDLPNKPYFVTIEKTGPIDLKLAAEFAGMTIDEFVALNPAHNRPVIAASRNNQIKLPADRLDAFIAAVELHGAKKLPFASWQPYTLKAGETLADIARRGQVSVEEIARANDLRPNAKLLAGTRILAPQRSVEDERLVEKFDGPRVYEQVSVAAAYHRVRKRETLASIARRYRVSVARLRSLNPSKSATPGTLLLVRPASIQTVVTNEHGVRRVIRSVPISDEAQPVEAAEAKRPARKPAAAAATPRRTSAQAAGKTAGPARASAKSKVRKPNI